MSDDVTGVPDDWRETLEDLAERRRHATSMGGEQRLAKRAAEGRLNARQRVAALLDDGTFREFGRLVGDDVPSDAFVAGSGLIDGRPVMLGAEDFTTLAGTIGGGSNAKRYRLAELALNERVPLIMLLDGAGFRPGSRSHGRSPTDLLAQARCSGNVPIITGVMGASAGHGALIAPISNFVVMTEDSSIFTAGPPVVKQSTGEDVHKLDLGGPSVAIPSGLVHNLAANDQDALEQIRRYLSYFPSSAWSYPMHRPTDDGYRSTPELLSIIPRNNRQVYDMRRAIEVIVDDHQWWEVQAGYGEAIVCALAHLGGESVAIVANQPQVLAGSIDADAASKAARFITIADSFHLPIVFLSDNPGVLPGTVSEREGILRAGARMFAAQSLATTVKLHVTFRKAYGFGSMVMGMVSFDRQTGSYAFPGATLGAMGADASSNASKADDEVRAELRRLELQASYNSASNLGFDELIDPRETRDVLLDGLNLAMHRRQAVPEPVARVGITP